MAYKKLSDIKPKDANPFIDNLFEIKTKRQKLIAGNADEIIVNRDTGAVEGHTAFMRYKEVDPSQFVKLFTNSISALYDLDTNSIRVFGYIMKNIKPNSDQIYLNPNSIKSEIGYKSPNAVISGLAKLCEKQFIDRSSNKHWYYINPSIFFNGDRVSFIQSYKKKSVLSPSKRSNLVDIKPNDQLSINDF